MIPSPHAISDGPSYLAESTHVSNAHRGLYNAYEPLTTPGNLISADFWATSFVNNHASTFVHANSSLSTGTNFATGEGYNNDDAVLNAPIRHNWEAAGATAHSVNHTFAPLIDSTSSRLTDNTFAAGAIYSDVAAIPYTLIPYTWGPAATTAHSGNYTFAPFIAPDPLRLVENNFVTGAAYNGGNANSGAPWGSAATTQFTHPFGDPGLQYADPTFPMMSPFASDANGPGNDYQGRIAPPSFNTPLEAIVDLPKTPHSTNDSNLDLAPQRPTCAECNKSFTRKADLDRHAKKHQADAKVFRCGVAGCTFDNYRKDKVSVHFKRRLGGVGAVLTLA